MKKIYTLVLLLMVGLFASNALFAQPWKKTYYPQKKSNYTFFDYQKAAKN